MKTNLTIKQEHTILIQAWKNSKWFPIRYMKLDKDTLIKYCVN